MTLTHGTMMADSPPNISTLTPEELLGPLNDVEQRYAPKMLHVAGIQTFPLPKPRVAIVGSRKASSNAIKTATSIAKTLVKNGSSLSAAWPKASTQRPTWPPSEIKDVQ